jgi:hypothetical protein
MSSLATVFLAEDDALGELTSYWERAKGEKAIKMTLIEYLRATAPPKPKLDAGILVVTGLPSLLKQTPTEETDPINHLRSALRNTSRDSAILIQVEDLEWDPIRRENVTLQGHTVHVSEILTQDTYTLKDHIKIGATKGKRRDDYVKVKL